VVTKCRPGALGSGGCALCDYFRIGIPAWVERSAQPTRSAPTDVMFGPLSPDPREPQISGHSCDIRRGYQNLIGWAWASGTTGLRCGNK
jgi:hypothetical protein